MKEKNYENKSSNAPLLITLIICLLVLAILVVCVVQKFSGDVFTTTTTTPALSAGQDDPEQFIELPIVEGMSLADTKRALEELGISYEIVPVNSKKLNRVESYTYSGKIEDGKNLIEIGTTVKIYTNEVPLDKVIYLTFDDGPTYGNTTPILDMLEERGILATFFVEGYDVTLYPQKMLDTANRGHLVGCHSFSHVYGSIYASTDAFIAEIDKYEQALITAIGEEAFAKMPKVLRFPGGTNNVHLTDSEALIFIEAIRGEGYAVYDWTALTNDADNTYRQDGESDLDYFMRSLQEGLESAKNQGLPLIVLMHDKQTMRDCLEDVLDYLVGEGYYFDTIDNCPEYTFVER